MHERAKLVAAVGITFEHVERRCAGRKKNDLAGFGRGVRAFDRIGQRCGKFGFDRVLPIARNAFRHFADQDRRSYFFFHQRAERFEVKSFILSASDENDRFGLRAQRFLNRVEIRRLGIVDVIDTADLPNEFAPMRPWFRASLSGIRCFANTVYDLIPR